MFIRLSYASQAIASCDGREVDGIVSSADQKNRMHDITGILSFDDGRIIQIIEGPPTAVDRLFDMIRRDPRHTGVVELSRLETDARAFGSWGMTSRPFADVLAWAY